MKKGAHTRVDKFLKLYWLYLGIFTHASSQRALIYILYNTITKDNRQHQTG